MITNLSCCIITTLRTSHNSFAVLTVKFPYFPQFWRFLYAYPLLIHILTALLLLFTSNEIALQEAFVSQWQN